MFHLVFGAVEISQIIGICVLVLSVLSWFVNLVQGKTPDGAARPQPQKMKPKPARSEIESLLKQLTEDKPKLAQPRKEQQQQAQQTPKPAKGRSNPNATVQRPGGPPPFRPSRQPPRPAETPIPASNRGNGMRSQPLASRVESEVQREAAAATHHDLGNRIAAAKPPAERTVHPLVKVLRDPNGIRQAFLLNEILQPPKALRR